MTKAIKFSDLAKGMLSPDQDVRTTHCKTFVKRGEEDSGWLSDSDGEQVVPLFTQGLAHQDPLVRMTLADALLDLPHGMHPTLVAAAVQSALSLRMEASKSADFIKRTFERAVKDHSPELTALAQALVDSGLPKAKLKPTSGESHSKLSAALEVAAPAIKALHAERRRDTLASNRSTGNRRGPRL